jgi:hypothetical protein
MKIIAKPLPLDEVDNLVATELNRLVLAGDVEEIILFGSAVRGEMTDCSDLDFVAIYANDERLEVGRRQYYESCRGKNWPTDVLFVTREAYNQKSAEGGVFFVCRQEGRSLYRSTT